MSAPVSGPRCPRCSAPVDPTQEYCLECGLRLPHDDPGALDRASAALAERHGWATPWLLPALLGLVIAVLGTGAAIAISDDGEAAATPSTATGGSITATSGGETIAPPEPTTATTTSTGPTTAPTTTTAPKPKPPANPAAIAWPRNKRGWTIVLLSLPQSGGRGPAEQRAKEARGGGLRRVGVLDSSRFASLHPGYYVIFTGVYESQAEAAGALPQARAVFPAAYQREIVP